MIIIPYTTEPFAPTAAFPHKTSITRPVILTGLEYNNKVLQFQFGSIIDSGADHCVFPAQFGEAAGIDVRSGKEQASRGIGSDTAFFHQVNVRVFINNRQYQFPCWAGFMYSLDQIGKGLLGRHGFFELFDVISFKDQHIELSPKSVTPSQPHQAQDAANK